jgi:hypothetical protein
MIAANWLIGATAPLVPFSDDKSTQTQAVSD